MMGGFRPPTIRVPGAFTSISPLAPGASGIPRAAIKRSCSPSLRRGNVFLADERLLIAADRCRHLIPLFGRNFPLFGRFSAELIPLFSAQGNWSKTQDKSNTCGR
jgi:hypothetical protein